MTGAVVDANPFHCWDADMVTESRARALALSLPEAVEQDHHGFPSFRVTGKIFATMPDAEHLNVMIAADDVDVAVAENAESCEQLRWGARIAGVRVTLSAADEDTVRELLTDAWRRKAPKRLQR
ncbi:MAG: MmcQ/YjbR family DNA-binding protein [Sciscionella sp.]|nr:MmcQ/YjbR family DNA-binding protein [Sciscionella sp.]